MRASTQVLHGTKLATCCTLAAALIAATAPSAGAADHLNRHHRRHHHHHHHARARGALLARTNTGGCTYANLPATTGTPSEMRAAVVCLINQQRNMRGLPSLEISTKLNASAQSWNQWMVSTGNFTHGSNFAGRISAVGYNWQTAGENIATGFATPSAVVAAWMASPDHCRNILDPAFRDIGTGVTTAAVGTFATQPSTWTNDFGLLMTQNPPSRDSGPQNGCPY